MKTPGPDFGSLKLLTHFCRVSFALSSFAMIIKRFLVRLKLPKRLTTLIKSKKPIENEINLPKLTMGPPIKTCFQNEGGASFVPKPTKAIDFTPAIFPRGLSSKEDVSSYKIKSLIQRKSPGSKMTGANNARVDDSSFFSVTLPKSSTP